LLENKFRSELKYLLEDLLEKQEDFDLAVLDDISPTSRRFLLRSQDKLQVAKDKLTYKLSLEEIEKLCQVQTEISRLETLQEIQRRTNKKPEKEKFVAERKL
jgi:hypothetical protein